MNVKTIILTLFLVIGITFSNCNPDDVICSCPPIIEFFDIQGLELTNYKKREECCRDAIAENEEVTFSEYRNLSIYYDVNFISQNHKNWNFSLMNSALACSCLEDGESGSKEEKLSSLTILTLNDFDADHLANDTINDLFHVANYPDLDDLNEYILQDTSLIKYQFLDLNLKKAPELDNEFKVKVIIELSTNETYESESAAIRIN